MSKSFLTFSCLMLGMLILVLVGYVGSPLGKSIAEVVGDSYREVEEKARVEESADTFMKAFLTRDFDTMLQYVDPGPESIKNVKDGLISASDRLMKARQLAELTQGNGWQVYYEVYDVELIDETHARVTYLFTADSGDQAQPFPLTFVKTDGVWKLYYPSLLSQFMGKSLAE
ncbi:nuclear transport factor 2 family protein [Candidatus Formimonas warabiya]|uniref:Low molecular weight antigen MTB12-like C-terminal domain-containing protein n=1 Tax=Formimonas warabiya TaxID=1761012 RepID=A0A3G1KPA9_FORW1|nr:nuclear transport factor 2 family protein [Candidatus Formimonas warabiya]ATW24302.1 hypothetical protein DCMF_05415 [Candidatus Formimonas warabiya]